MQDNHKKCKSCKILAEKVNLARICQVSAFTCKNVCQNTARCFLPTRVLAIYLERSSKHFLTTWRTFRKTRRTIFGAELKLLNSLKFLQHVWKRRQSQGWKDRGCVWPKDEIFAGGAAIPCGQNHPTAQKGEHKLRYNHPPPPAPTLLQGEPKKRNTIISLFENVIFENKTLKNFHFLCQSSSHYATKFSKHDPNFQKNCRQF